MGICTGEQILEWVFLYNFAHRQARTNQGEWNDSHICITSDLWLGTIHYSTDINVHHTMDNLYICSPLRLVPLPPSHQSDSLLLFECQILWITFHVLYTMFRMSIGKWGLAGGEIMHKKASVRESKKNKSRSKLISNGTHDSFAMGDRNRTPVRLSEVIFTRIYHQFKLLRLCINHSENNLSTCTWFSS